MKTIVKTIDTKIHIYSDGSWSFGEEIEKEPKFVVGKKYPEFGGYFLFSDEGYHYFIASEFHSVHRKWSEYGTGWATEDSFLCSDGMALTKLVADADPKNIAANHFKGLQITIGCDTFYDWFLPSKYELLKISSIRDVFNVKCGAYERLDGCYWSSNEFDLENAVYVEVGNGSESFALKTQVMEVRPVRKIPIQ